MQFALERSVERQAFLHDRSKRAGCVRKAQIVEVKARIVKLCGVSFVAEAHLHINAGYLFAHEGEVFAAHARRELGVDTRFAVHRLECRQDGAHQRRIINLGRIAALVVKLDFTAKYRADALSDFIEASFGLWVRIVADRLTR